ncbi:MAG: NAD(P)/FAD-dependent oxidoreductase [Dehalococcoidia bacterium]
MAGTPDVLIAGGGIIGCSIAYHLSKEGARVTIIERESIGSQASGAATGLLVPMASLDTPDHFVQLTDESCKRHKEIIPELEELSGVETQYGGFSWLELAFTEEEERELRQELGWHLDSPNVSWFTDADIRRLEPRTTPRANAGIYVEGQAQVDAYRLTLAFAGAAEALGTTIKYGEVTGLTIQNGRVSGLSTSLGNLPADTVVFAMGSWSKGLEGWIGMPVPVEPLKGQTIHLEVPDPPIPCMIHHVASYVAPKLGGITIAGTYDGYMGYDTTIHEEGKALITEGVETVCPGVMESKIVTHVTGLRPASVDFLPILGPVPGIGGAYIATGHQRLGITLSAITGELMSQLILTGKTRLPLATYRLDRFGEGDLEVKIKDRYGLVN